MSDFPTSLPSFTDLDGNLTLAANNHAGRHNKVHDEIAAVAAKVGIDSSADTGSIDYKVATHTSNTSNPHSVTKSQIGLPNVDNTSDATKLAATLLAVYPVGAIYIGVVSTDPGTLFGGTWVAFGSGKTLVGLDSGQTEFDTVEETGGAKSHKHKGYGDADSGETAGDLRAAIGAGNNNANTLAYNSISAVNPNTGAGVSQSGYVVTGSSSSAWSPWNHFTPVYGYTSTKSHLPPYIVVYFFKRTA